ncbi:hypothetical protein THAR02_09333 [Trichoderma harzianum]|uniref:Uncharacterized protein n=1 Tax=Trichoderma harzianum TaxID=5544 RepID=A0A0F9XD33_TRIHA|nr:hypothetical protein THAR02_09333 [Trichoderma harzianum]
MADASMYDPSKLSEYPVPVAHVNYSAPGVVVSVPHDVDISVVIVGQKRLREELDSNDVAEPDSKRPAISMGLGDANSQDIDMSAIVSRFDIFGMSLYIHLVDTNKQNICLSPPGNFCSTSPGKFHVVDPPSPGGWRPDDDHIWRALHWSTVEDHIKDSICKETGGSYWYRMSSSDQQGPNEKLIQDIRLDPRNTFFHIREMINARHRISYGSKEVVLFARVVHTGCGGFDHQSFQCFKLEDLFGGKPHISGIMMFKDTESPIYCESSPFLAATKTEDKCYCLCELVEDDKAALRWSLHIYDIQPVSWETIRSVHANLGKQGLD